MSQVVLFDVEQELVVALQWMVILFENSFLSVALQELLKDSPQVVIATGN